MVRNGMGITFVTKRSLLLISEIGLVMGQPVFGFGCIQMKVPSRWQLRDDQGEVGPLSQQSQNSSLTPSNTSCPAAEGAGIGNEACDFQVSFPEPSPAGFTAQLAALPKLEQTHSLKDMNQHIPVLWSLLLPHTDLPFILKGSSFDSSTY